MTIKSTKYLLTIITILFVFSPYLASQDIAISKKKYYTKRIAVAPPRIDGLLNDYCWEDGEWEGRFVQRKPKSGAEPSQKTEFKILYDEKNLFIAFKCYDNEPNKIEKLIGQRDQMKGDAVGIAIDSYFDKRTAFEFDVTVANGKIDMMASEDGQRWDFNWDAVWYAKTSITDWGWIAEIQIPLSQLRYSEKESHVWGLHIQRRIYRTNEEDNWQLIPIDASGMVHLFGELHGIEGLKKNRRFEYLPYTVGQIKFNEKEAGNPFSTSYNKAFSGGFDAKIGLSSNFTLDLSINPDFGQVEADPGQLNLTVYETFFPEKRQFFIEGRNMLETDIGEGSLFYSRRIGSPPKYCPELNDNEYSKQPDITSILSSAKITGKTNKGLSVGILQSITTNENANVIDNSGKEYIEEVEPYTNYFVSKVQKDINDGNTVFGGTVTSVNRFINSDNLDFLNKSAYSAGFNLLHQWKEKTYYVELKNAISQIYGTTTAITRAQESSLRYFQRPDVNYLNYDTNLTKLAGYGGTMEIGKKGNGKWEYYERVNWISPSMDINDVGFQKSADNIKQKSIVIYNIYEPKYIYNKYSAGMAQFSGWDFGGNNLYVLGEVFFGMEFTNLWRINTGVTNRINYHDPKMLRGGPMMRIPSYYNFYFSGETDARKTVSFELNTMHNIYNDKISESHYYNLGSYMKINEAVTFNVNISFNTNIVDYQYVTTIDDKYIIANLDRNTASLTLRLGLYLTPEISLQYYGNPYFSVGKYTNYRKVINSLAVENKKKYDYFTSSEISYNSVENQYEVIEADSYDTYSFNCPDFKDQQFRSNFVFRWEYKPASTFYLVWTHSRNNHENLPNYNIVDAVSGLFDIYPENVFLFKLSYWFSI